MKKFGVLVLSILMLFGMTMSVYAAGSKSGEDADTFTITYDLNGGTLNGQTGKVTVSVKAGTTITLPKPSRDGYNFSYWKGSKYDAGAQYKVESDHTFQAQWEKKSSGSSGTSSSSSSSGSSSSKVSPKTGVESTWMAFMVAGLAFAAAAFAGTRKRV